LPIIYAPAGDITAYLPTNVMSMTDGQWVLDMKVFKELMRPAIHTGLSVTRVGGVAQNKRQKALAAALNKTLAGYRVADEYAHFGTELSPESQADYEKGKLLFQLMNQDIGETYSLMDQQLMLDIVLNAQVEEVVDVPKLKSIVKEYSARVQEDKDLKGNWEQLRDELKAQVVTIDQKKKAEREKREAARAEEEARAAAAEKAMASSDIPGSKPKEEAKPSEAAKEETKAEDKK